MEKRAVLVGINKYDQAPLRGCVNDVIMIGDMLIKQFKFTTEEMRVLIDNDATTQNIFDSLHWLVDGANPGDVLFFHFSGHGSQILSYNGKEENGYDEILCPVDLNWRDKMIVDNDLRKIFDKVPEGVSLTVILDCCHSGTALDHTKQYQPYGPAQPINRRDIFGLMEEDNGAEYAKSRMLQPPTELAVDDKYVGISNPRKLAHNDVPNYPGLLISGCQADQTSADAFIAGQYCGAASYAFCKAIREHHYMISYKEVVEKMNNFMIEYMFTQRPELGYGVDELIFNDVLRVNQPTKIEPMNEEQDEDVTVTQYQLDVPVNDYEDQPHKEDDNKDSDKLLIIIFAVLFALMVGGVFFID